MKFTLIRPEFYHMVKIYRLVKASG